jgi:hypothetical protein
VNDAVRAEDGNTLTVWLDVFEPELLLTVRVTV